MKTLAFSIFAAGVGVIAWGQWRIEKAIRDHQETTMRQHGIAMRQQEMTSAARAAEPVKPVSPPADNSKRVVNALDSLRFYFMQRDAQEKNSETLTNMLEAERELEY